MNLPGINRTLRILVLANDAGGAEMLGAMLEREGHVHEWRVYAPRNSSAKAVFLRRRLGHLLLERPQETDRLDYLRRQDFDILVFNPGWRPFPMNAVTAGLGKGKPVVAFMDHWKNFRERFRHPRSGWRADLPEFALVSDSHARDQALQTGFSNVMGMRHYLAEELRRAVKRQGGLRSGFPGVLLFISQTVSCFDKEKTCNGAFDYLGRLERLALKGLLGRFGELSGAFGFERLEVRLHPSEKSWAHLDLLETSEGVPFTITPSQERPFAEALAGAALTVGLDSTALFLAFCCGKPVVSFIPDQAAACALPLPEGLIVRSTEALARLTPASLTIQGGPEFYPGHGVNAVLRRIAGIHALQDRAFMET